MQTFYTRIYNAAVLTVFAITLLSSSYTIADTAQLSETARSLIPETPQTFITLVNGAPVQGELAGQTEDAYRIRVSTPTATILRNILLSDVVSVETVSTATHLANALQTLELDPRNSLEPTKYQEALALFEEFLALFPDHPQAGNIKELQNAFRDEYAYIERGMRKIEGEWYLPVQAAVRDFDLTSQRLTQMEEAFRGIERETWNQNPQARQKYDELRDRCRAIARDLPRIMTDRLPFLLQEQQYDDAFTEMNAFLKFWISGVIETETRASDRNRLGRSVFEGMDFEYLARLQSRIMEAYMATVARESRDTPPPNLIIHTTQVYIPGGYFFMGNRHAKPQDPDFPIRVVKVSPFLMDRYQVTNAEYREFVEHVRTTGDYSMSHPSAPPLKDHTPAGWSYPALSHDDQPVVGVDWFDAYAYLRWRGKRLPTEAEWEMAARGRDERTYSWGASSPARVLNNTPAGREHIAGRMDEQVPPPTPPRQSRFSCSRQPPPPPESLKTILPTVTWPVNQLLPPEAQQTKYHWGRVDPFSLNPYGLYHMGGNAAEWVSDWYDLQYYTKLVLKNPQGPERGTVRAFRGASYLCSSEDLARTFNRRTANTDAFKQGIDGREGKPMIGIRGVQDIP